MENLRYMFISICDPFWENPPKRGL